MDAQSDVEKDFADSTSRLVDLMMPDATPKARLDALRAIATIAFCTELQTIHHMTGQGTPWETK